jgi:hypothetical protein
VMSIKRGLRCQLEADISLAVVCFGDELKTGVKSTTDFLDAAVSLGFGSVELCDRTVRNPPQSRPRSTTAAWRCRPSPCATTSAAAPARSRKRRVPGPVADHRWVLRLPHGPGVDWVATCRRRCSPSDHPGLRRGRSARPAGRRGTGGRVARGPVERSEVP